MQRMLFPFLVFSLLCIQWGFSGAAEDDFRTIQGSWRVAKLTAPGQRQVSPKQLSSILMTLKDGTYVSTAGSHIERGTYVLDPSKTPKWITMTVTRGGATGSTIHGIYTLQGDRLIFSYPLQPGAPRPTSLHLRDATSWVVVEYVRVKE